MEFFVVKRLSKSGKAYYVVGVNTPNGTHYLSFDELVAHKLCRSIGVDMYNLEYDSPVSLK